LINYTIEQYSSLDKLLKGVSDDVTGNKIDSNSNLVGRLLSNAISMYAYSSQAIIQEISLKSSNV
jgi:hypothetical protein